MLDETVALPVTEAEIDAIKAKAVEDFTELNLPPRREPSESQLRLARKAEEALDRAAKIPALEPEDLAKIAEGYVAISYIY